MSTCVEAHVKVKEWIVATLVSVFIGSKLVLKATCLELTVSLNGDFSETVRQFGQVSHESDDWDQWTHIVPTPGTRLRIADLPALPFGVYLKEVGTDLSLRFDSSSDMEIYTENIDIITPLRIRRVE